MTTNAERLQQIVLQEIDELSTLTEDWAGRRLVGNTYEYVQDSNALYTTENLQVDSFASLSLDFLVIFDLNNQPAVAGVIDPEAQQVASWAFQMSLP